MSRATLSAVELKSRNDSLAETADKCRDAEVKLSEERARIVPLSLRVDELEHELDLVRRRSELLSKELDRRQSEYLEASGTAAKDRVRILFRGAPSFFPGAETGNP